MSLKFPSHKWTSAPDCPECDTALDWVDGDDGGGIQPPYDGYFECSQCGQMWGEEGP